MFNDQLLAGRRILVTGGGTGLGKSMAARFLELGAEVHICGRRKSVCDETATELMDLYGGRVVSHGVDIRNAMAVDEMIEQIWTAAFLPKDYSPIPDIPILLQSKVFGSLSICGRVWLQKPRTTGVESGLQPI